MKAAGVADAALAGLVARRRARRFYVQDRMREVGRELWAWLADGAHVYVCGDAKRMAKDVERALVESSPRTARARPTRRSRSWPS